MSKSERPIRRACVGKVVVYADSDLTIPAWDDWPTARDAFLPNLPCLADRPKSGSRVLRGHPVCSLLAAGASESECREELDNRLLELQCHFRVAGVEISVRLNKS